MRVAVVSPYALDRPGGVQDQALKLAMWLQGRGHEAWVVAPGTTGPAGSRLVGRTTDVPANRSSAPIALGRGAAARTREALAGADVVHVHEPFMPVVSVAAVRGASCPVVATFHADPSRVVRGAYRRLSPAWRRLARRIDVATAVSPVAQRAVAPIVAARIVPNGVAIGEAPSAERSSSRVVFVGRDDERKGLGVLLDAWPTVRRAHPAAELHLVSATNRTLPAGVVAHRDMDDAAKRSLLERSAVAVAPNLGGESFGLVVAEAMAAGCAVVASGLEAFVSVAGDAAAVVAPGDVPGLARAVLELLGDPERAAALGAAGRRRVERFGLDQAFDGYVEAYRDATQEPLGQRQADS